MTDLKLSVVIICWNDRDVLSDCLDSLIHEARAIPHEVILCDNGSTDGSKDLVARKYPSVRIIDNGSNIGFGAGNNPGIRTAQGKYTLILNPDTVIHENALTILLQFADQHSDAGVIGCRVLNPDGTLQVSARPFPTLMTLLISALWLRWITPLVPRLECDTYVGWKADTTREIDWQMGCCLLIKTDLAKSLGGFDERFSYHFEEVDLCYRVKQLGHRVLFCPHAVITHYGAQARGRFSPGLRVETHRNRYRFFYKHYGASSLRFLRWISILQISLRWFPYKLASFARNGDLAARLNVLSALLAWNWRLDPVRFVESGIEPDVGVESVFAKPGHLQSEVPSQSEE